jgi:hypothetical protein
MWRNNNTGTNIKEVQCRKNRVDGTAVREITWMNNNAGTNVEELQSTNKRGGTRVQEHEKRNTSAGTNDEMKEKTSFFADDSFSTGSLLGTPGHDEK